MIFQLPSLHKLARSDVKKQARDVVVLSIALACLSEDDAPLRE